MDIFCIIKTLIVAQFNIAIIVIEGIKRNEESEANEMDHKLSEAIKTNNKGINSKIT